MAVLAASLVASLVAAAPVAPATRVAPAKSFVVPEKRVPGRALLKLTSSTKAAAALPSTSALKELGGRVGVDVTFVRASVFGWFVVDVKDFGSDAVPDEDRTAELIDLLGEDDAVAGVSEDTWKRPLFTPNDPGIAQNQQWPISVAKINLAWDTTQGLSSQRVGVIDTGLVRGHEDLQGRVAGGFDFISNSGSSLDGDGRDAEFQDNGDRGGGQGSFHGTHVAGTIGAATNNGTGIAGINPNTQLVIARALGFGGGDLADIMDAAAWLAGFNVAGVPAIGGNRVSVMNLSLGSQGGCTQFEQDVVNQIDGAGVIFVAAAGNDSGPVNSPANCNNVVAVAAHGQTRVLAPYSSFGNEIDIVAPGGDQTNFGFEGGVISTLGPGNSDYGFFEGTSMAAPHVTGVISLMQAIDPAMNRAKAEQLMTSTGQACTNCGSRLALDADAAVRATTPGVDPPPPPPPPPPPDGDDDFEENDDATAGRNLSCGAELDLVALPGDQDWFDVSIEAGAFSVTINGVTDADLDLYLVSGGQIAAQSENGGGDENINVQVQGSGVVQVLVNPFVDTANNVENTGAYHLSLACTDGTTPLEPDPTPDPPPPPVNVDSDDFEPNDSETAAGELFCQQKSDLTMTADDDWFFVDVRDGDTLRVEKTGAGGSDVAIVDLDGNLLSSGGRFALARGLGAGRYLVHVPAGASDDYTLDVACVASGGSKPSAKAGCSSTGSGTWFSLGALLLLLRRRRR